MIKVNEYFHTIQGEGPTAGQQATFLRLAGCNLACSWCDSKYAWHPKYQEPIQSYLPTELAKKIISENVRRLVITGGEPLLQQDNISSLLSELPNVKIEIETNGTIIPSKMLTNRVDQWNCSPKLNNSGNDLNHRYKPQVLKILGKLNTAFKFVIANEKDIKDVIRQFGHLLPPEKIWLMPLGHSQKQQFKRMNLIADLANKYHFNFSPRLQILLYDTARKV